jgi:hypothetical protein
MNSSRIRIALFAAAIFFASGIFSSSSFAQQPVETQAAPLLYPKRSLRPEGVLNSDSMSFNVVRKDSDWADVSSGTQYTYNCKVFNTTSNPLDVYFLRSQRLPIGWVTSVCWGVTCFPNGDSLESYSIAPHDSAALELNVTPILSETPDSSTVWLRVGIVDSAADTVQLAFYSSFRPGNPPLIFDWYSTPKYHTAFNGPGTYLLSNFLQNHSAYAHNVQFSMQDTIPQGWTLTKCVEDSCSWDQSVVYPFAAYGDSLNRNLHRIKFTIKVPVLTKKDSVVLHLGVNPKTENPADSANYRFVAVVNSHLVDSVSNRPFLSGAGDTITAQLKNLLTVGNSYHFSLSTVLPSGWSVNSLCVGDSCSSGSEVTSPFDAIGALKANQSVVVRLKTVASVQPDTGILYLSSYPADNPSDLRIDTFHAVANPSSEVTVNSNIDETAGLAVTNAWPNPVYGNGKLSLDILTDHAGSCKAIFYDLAGIEQATVDLGTLHLGANEIQIPNPNLSSGEYIIRIDQGNDASEVIRINFVR